MGKRGTNIDIPCSTEKKKMKKTCKGILVFHTTIPTIALIVCTLLMCVLVSCADTQEEYGTLPPIDDMLLSETKPDGFDIMEYEEYLNRDRNIYFAKNGMKESIPEDMASNYGDDFEVVYNVIIAIRDGDATLYNLYMGNDRLKKNEFTQQQIYDVVITLQSTGTESEDGASYQKTIFKVEYKIHENNGTYRNTIESDASRPVFFIVDNSSGEMLITQMIEQGYKH